MIDSYVQGEFRGGTGDGEALVDPSSEEVIDHTSTAGIDMAAALRFARDKGGPALRALSFAARGKMLAAMAGSIHERRDTLIAAAQKNGGNTRADAKFDIDGATATLTHYADLGAALGDKHVLADADVITLGRNPRWVGGHVWTSRRGVAVHINAFNFPAWNMMEKAAVALLAGMPVVSKPAGSTALVAQLIMRGLVDDGVLPPGAFSMLCGEVGDLLSQLESQDLIAFTGSAATAAKIRAHERVVATALRLTLEADSLNAAVLGIDAAQGSAVYDMALGEIAREITQKSGQKCTATRRIFVPRYRLREVEHDLVERLQEVVYGNPQDARVKMGPVATRKQLLAVQAGIAALACRTATGGVRGTPTGVDGERGFFIAPTLLVAEDAHKADAVHSREVFGPVATLLPYDGSAADAGALVRRGGGSLVTSVYSDDERFCEAMLAEVAASTGRLYFGGEKVAEHTLGPGVVLAALIHGGPGRAGGGEELGSRRGLEHYMQRSAVQGYKPIVERLTGVAHV